jgi:hypothetical protein
MDVVNFLNLITLELKLIDLFLIIIFNDLYDVIFETEGADS